MGRRRKVARTIRRQIKSEKNRQLLRTHRAFKVDPKTPEEIKHLLDQLEKIEREQVGKPTSDNDNGAETRD